MWGGKRREEGTERMKGREKEGKREEGNEAKRIEHAC
jgi:hypothetical protein